MYGVWQSLSVILTLYMFIGPPLPPTIHVTDTSTDVTQICFSSYSYYPVSSYEYSVTDFTGDGLLTSVQTLACAYLPEGSFLKACSPYSISAKAYNKVGGSNTSSINSYVKGGNCNNIICFTNDDSTISQCISMTTTNFAHVLNKRVSSISHYHPCINFLWTYFTVKIEINSTTKGEASAGIEMLCDKLQSLSQIDIIMLQLQEVGPPRKQNYTNVIKTIPCNGSQQYLEYSNLTKNAHYNISSIWIMGNVTHLCNITQIIIRKFNAKS